MDAAGAASSRISRLQRRNQYPPPQDPGNVPGGKTLFFFVGHDPKNLYKGSGYRLIFMKQHDTPHRLDHVQNESALLSYHTRYSRHGVDRPSARAVKKTQRKNTRRWMGTDLFFGEDYTLISALQII